jgi:hypothetical protein
MRINMSKVLVGGIVAAVVLIVIDFITYKYVFGTRMAAEMDAYHPGASTAMSVSTGIITMVVNDLITGILLVWLYAAIRPRFGPGPRTAVYAAIFVWILGALFSYGYLSMGMMSSGLWWEYGIVWLIVLLIAGQAGAKLYSEEGMAA